LLRTDTDPPSTANHFLAR